MSHDIEQQKTDILNLLHLKRQYLNSVAQGLAVERAALELEKERLETISQTSFYEMDVADIACGEAAKRKAVDLLPKVSKLRSHHRALLEQVLKLDIAAKNLK